MMNISMYLGQGQGGTINAKNPENGNPGIGGTQYCILMLAHYLHANGIDVTLMAVRPYILEKGINFIKVKGDDEVVPIAERIGSDILILRDFPNSVLKEDVRRSDIKVVVWSHNYIYSDFCDYISKTPQVKCNVFVGKQQYDRYIDDDVIKKSVTIFNMFHDDCNIKRKNDGRTVVYMGSIVEGKGFYELCKIWKDILLEVPEAQLLVLGSGKLYGEVQLGAKGIASEEYENKFLQYIIDDNGDILPSIKFLGILGGEKLDVFLKSSVGVVNPSGRTETFGMGIVEMAAATLPVVTIGTNGHFDTVVNGKTGILASSLSGVKDAIIALLKDKEQNEKLGLAAKQYIKKFEPSLIVESEWIPLLKSIYEDIPCVRYSRPVKPYTNNFKWLRIFNRLLRINVGMEFLPSSVAVESFLVRIIKRIR